METDIKYFDIHGHVNFPEYDNDRDEVIARATGSGIGLITVGTDTETSQSALALANKYKNIWATVGIHPNEEESSADHSSGNIDIISRIAREERVVAIGECGLDYFRSRPEVYDSQRNMFIEQIRIANNVGKPMILHVRNGRDISAYDEAVDILKEYSKMRVDFHFFAGNMAELKRVLDIGASVSFTGVVTFTHDYDELVKYAPSDRIMTETDCPFVAPKPHRGKRNEPSYVMKTLKSVAMIRGESVENMAHQVRENVRNFFGI